MAASDALGPQWVMMHPRELLRHAEDRSEPSQARNVDELAGRISRQGYRSRTLDGPYGKAGEHIHLGFTDAAPEGFLVNGNHRVHALNKIGYDKPVKVRVSDKRTKS